PAGNESAKLYEVQKYMSLTNHAWSAEWLIVNADFWKSLPTDLQGVVERNQQRYVTTSRTQMKTDIAGLINKARAHGMTVNEVDQTPFRAGLKNYYTAWANNF